MRAIPAFMMFPFFALSQLQSDTIFKKSGEQIICVITEVTPEYIYFNFNKLKGRYIHKENVSVLSLNGKRTHINYVGTPETGQTYSSGLRDTVAVSQELDHIKLCLRKCHKEFTIGLITVGA